MSISKRKIARILREARTASPAEPMKAVEVAERIMVESLSTAERQAYDIIAANAGDGVTSRDIADQTGWRIQYACNVLARLQKYSLVAPKKFVRARGKDGTIYKRNQ